MAKRETIDTHIYFPPEVFEGIKKLAGINRRSITAEIVLAVEERLAFNKMSKSGPKVKKGKG